MRALAWSFLICTVLSTLGVFVPSVEVPAASEAVGRRRASLSLYQANSNRELVRRLVMNYHRSTARPIGAALIAVMSPKLRGKLKGVLGDARDAMDALDGVTDSDAATLGKVLAATLWGFLALHLVMGGFVFTEVMRVRGFRAWRLVAAVGVSCIVTVGAIALHVLCTRAVFEANDEVGHEVVSLAVGAYLIPIASACGLFAVCGLLVQHVRTRAAISAPQVSC